MIRLRPLLLLLCLCSIIGARAQDSTIVASLQRALATRRLHAVLIQADNSKAHWHYLRDVSPDHKEGVVDFEYQAPRGYYHSFQLQLLCYRSNLIYYKLSHLEYRQEKSGSVKYYEPIDQYQDTKGFEQFQRSFRSVFHTSPHDSDLFRTDIIYGQVCGASGGGPEHGNIAEQMRLLKSRASLVQWLQSANTEKQFHAINNLPGLGSMADDEMKIITFVLRKNGTMKTCQGCFSKTKDISDVARFFQSYLTNSVSQGAKY